ncbi:hypothetical protein [Vibrio phage RYC]|nr:hypothetical protein [Vibrio phage RYC]
MNVIQQAAKEDTVFATERGPISVIDLYKLPLRGAFSLDTLSRAYLKLRSTQSEESLVDVAPSKEDAALEFKIEVLKVVISDKQADAEAAVKRQDLDRQIAVLEAQVTRKKTEMDEVAFQEAGLESLVAELQKLKEQR